MTSLLSDILRAFLRNFLEQSLYYSFSQRDATGLTAENRELKLRLQAMEQQAHLRDGMLLIFAYVCQIFFSPSPVFRS